eukprot:SAG31_NODE_7297_length_1728_cov_1.027010_2_plen_221_part_00
MRRIRARAAACASPAAGRARIMPLSGIRYSDNFRIARPRRCDRRRDVSYAPAATAMMEAPLLLSTPTHPNGTQTSGPVDAPELTPRRRQCRDRCAGFCGRFFATTEAQESDGIASSSFEPEYLFPWWWFVLLASVGIPSQLVGAAFDSFVFPMAISSMFGSTDEAAALALVTTVGSFLGFADPFIGKGTVTFSFLCALLEKYGTFIARCNALIEKVPSCR